MNLWNKKLSYLFLLVFTVFFGCRSGSSQKDDELYKQYIVSISDVYGVQIKMPNHLIRVDQNIVDFDSEFTILRLINTECVSCFHAMENWKRFLSENKFHKKPKVIFIAEGEINDYFRQALSDNNYPFEILVDTTSSFASVFNLEQYPRGTFLLDGDAKIVATGSPINNKAILDLYNYLIQNERN